MNNEIPPITSLLGKYWEQPKREDILIDDHYAVMTEATRDKLQRYDCTFPSGVYSGKMWRTVGRADFLCWYNVVIEDSVTVETRRILVI